jgi:dUTP pyrophosphatase
MTPTLSFYKTHESAYLPEFATTGSACFDFKASLIEGSEVTSYSWLNSKETNTITEDKKLVLKPGHRYLVPTNLIIDIPEGYSVRIHPRSGLALKQGITLINCEGVIDSDYVDPTFITLYNTSDSAVTILDGDRVAQGEAIKSEFYSLAETKNKPVQKTNRIGGFGSTGVH